MRVPSSTTELAGLIGILEHDAVDMDYHLVVLGRRAWVDAVVECGLGQQLQGVDLLLSQPGDVRGPEGSE